MLRESMSCAAGPMNGTSAVSVSVSAQSSAVSVSLLPQGVTWIGAPIQVTPWGNKDTLTAEDWADTLTETALVPFIGPAAQLIDSRNIERVEFNEPLKNAVFTIPYDGRPVPHDSHDTPPMPTPVALTANLIYSEMLQLTSEVYRPVEGFIKATGERLAYQPGGDTLLSFAARS